MKSLFFFLRMFKIEEYSRIKDSFDWSNLEKVLDVVLKGLKNSFSHIIIFFLRVYFLSRVFLTLKVFNPMNKLISKYFTH